MATSKDYIWTRRDTETSRAYEAFRSYLKLGPERSLRKALEIDGKTTLSTFEQWSAQHNWVARCAAYDRHMDTAATDGMANQIASVREKHIELADKLLDHLSSRLDEIIIKRQDPSIRWIQAFATAAKVQQAAFALRDTDKTSEQIGHALELLDKVENLMNGGSKA